MLLPRIIQKTNKNCRVLGKIPLVVSDKRVKYTSDDEIETMLPKSKKLYRDAIHQGKGQQEKVSSEDTREE